MSAPDAASIRRWPSRSCTGRPVRVLQLIRLSCRKNTDLAIEVVQLSHEVTVLRRQIHRPVLQPADRAVLSGLWRLLARSRKDCLFVQPATLLRWHRDLVAGRGTYPTAGPAGHHSPPFVPQEPPLSWW